MVITYSESKDQPGKVANPARGQLNRENVHFPCPRSRLRIWSPETGSTVPSLVSLLISILRLNLVLTGGILPVFHISQPPSSQTRVNRVTQLYTDDVHCRESAGTGPVNSKVVPVTGAALTGHHGPIKMRFSFPHPLLV